MRLYIKKGKLPGETKYPKAPNYTMIGVKLTWEQAVNGLKKIVNIFKTKKDK